MTADEALEIDLAEELGARAEASVQLLTLYIPDKDRHGIELGTQRRWVLEAAALLARIGGGVTILPRVEGGWFDDDAGRIVWERPVVVYTYVKPERFVDELGALGELLHRMGRETNQGEVGIEFDHQFFRIREFRSA